eukprot:154195_1
MYGPKNIFIIFILHWSMAMSLRLCENGSFNFILFKTIRSQEQTKILFPTAESIMYNDIDEQRCRHFIYQFNDSSENSFVITGLNALFSDLQLKTLLPEYGNKHENIIFSIQSNLLNGICKRCAHVLVYELIIFSDKFHSCQTYDIRINLLLGFLMTAVLKHQFIATYFFRNSSNIKHCIKQIHFSFAKLCVAAHSIHKQDPLLTPKDQLIDVYKCLTLFGNQILRNAYLLKKCKYWRNITIHLMEWINKEFYHQIQGTSHIQLQQITVLRNVTWIISLSLYYHKKQNQFDKIKSKINVIKWR